jgi:signal transduction histidine kinase/DNA-binding response OmpR family regulator/ligand-binding sensor domain-containing protein
MLATERTRAVHFTDKEGLPRNIVSCFVQDDYGYGWIGTGNGISRFDGYKFINYEALEGEVVNTMTIDTNNELWVGTDAALYHYNRLTDHFELLVKGYTRQLTAYDNKIYYLLVNRLIQLNTDGTDTTYNLEGITSYDVTSEGIWYSPDRGVKKMGSEINLLPNRWISLIREIDGVLWIACRNGDLYSWRSGILQRVPLNNHYNIMDIELIDNSIWIATDGGGIIILDTNLHPRTILKKEQNTEALIPSNSIYDISHGMDDAVWISTYGAGLTMLTAGNNAFRNILPSSLTSNSLVDKEGVSTDVDGDIYYLGTNYGVSIWNSKTNRFKNLDSETLERQINGRKATAIYNDKENRLWIGTYDGLLGEYTEDLNLLRTFHPCSEFGSEMQQIIILHELDKNHLLIGSHYRNKSLLLFNKNTGKVDPVELDYRVSNKFNYQVNTIRKNKFGETIVLIRNLGVFMYNPEQNLLESFLPEINNRITFRLNDFYHDKTGNYWFATQTDGLVKLSPDGRIFERWTDQDGFPTNTLLSIESTDDKILWISSINGLCRFNTTTGQVQIFNYRHGLASNEFLPRTSFITDDDNILFGNSEGFVLMEPDKVLQDTSKSAVVISDISFHNQSIKKLEKESYLEKPLEETQKLHFPFRRNSFTISFFTHDNNLPKFSNYAYRLEGLENDWIYLGETNQTTYTNLSPGEYRFMVKCTNKSNIWNESPTTVDIIISHPWYTSWWAILAYILFTVFSFILFFWVYNKRVQLKNELEMSEYKVQAEHALTEKKLAFFTNISHDLKTPLTLISAPVKDLQRSTNLLPDERKKLEVIERNANRLYKLITDLIEFRKINNEQLPLQTFITDLQPTIENIYNSFLVECEKKDIDFSFESELNEPVCVDSKKIEKILWNLLSNSIKYTNIGGRIRLAMKIRSSSEGKLLHMEVQDTGSGFSAKEKERIFDRYYQVKKTQDLQIEGSGIGLSIVYDLVKLHHGEIELESEPGKGTLFSIRIPCSENCYTEAEKRKSSEISSETNLSLETSSNNLIESSYSDSEQKKYSRLKLLVVEDNSELRDYLANHFKKEFKLMQASDGVEGYEIACHSEPDIIITDVTMPKMNGHELCRKLRDNFDTSHIPIIMLTANNETEQKIEGISSGADIYLTKPLEINYLDAVVQNLLKNRRRIREKFLGIEQIIEQQEELNEADIKFINEVKEFILANITNENLNINMLASHLSISRTQLNRKIKALSGLTPNNYIKTIRLKKAYELIRNQGIRVSEAAYQTGFTDPNYFTICFKKEFGENPSKINPG